MHDQFQVKIFDVADATLQNRNSGYSTLIEVVQCQDSSYNHVYRIFLLSVLTNKIYQNMTLISKVIGRVAWGSSASRYGLRSHRTSRTALMLSLRVPPLRRVLHGAGKTDLFSIYLLVLFTIIAIIASDYFRMIRVLKIITAGFVDLRIV